MTSPTCAANPSAFASYSGDSTAQADALPVASTFVFQTVVVGVPLGPTPPMTMKPSETGTALEPARASGRAIASTFCQAPTVPSLLAVRLYTVLVGLPSGP